MKNFTILFFAVIMLAFFLGGLLTSCTSSDVPLPCSTYGTKAGYAKGSYNSPYHRR